MPQAYGREQEYELPFPYGEDYIFIMIKDPRCLFAYWEISDTKITDFERHFGKEALGNSHPMLKIINLQDNTENYVRVNDFSQDWYINVNETGGEYFAEVGRQFDDGFFVCFSRSNKVRTPNGKPSGNRIPVFANYRHVRAGRSAYPADALFERCMPYEGYAPGSGMMLE